MKRKADVRLARYGIPAAIAITLIASLRLYSFAYFWFDDFNNVYWTRREGFWNMLFTYVTMLPYVFLINHRFDLYLYMPSVGIAGLLALGIHPIQRRLQHIHPRPMAVAFLSALFSVAAIRHFMHEEKRGRIAREYYGVVFSEYRIFSRN